MLNFFNKILNKFRKIVSNSSSCPIYNLVTPESENLKEMYNLQEEVLDLYDCVMLTTCFIEKQELLLKSGVDSILNFDTDVGSIVGYSSDFDGESIPSYYLVSWANLKDPLKPILVKVEPKDLVAVCKPYQVLNGKINHLNRMFIAYYENWLNKMDPEDSTEQ